MAGSYAHCTDDDGSFRSDLIENLGDAREALQEMHFMVRWLAKNDPFLIEASHHAYLFHSYAHHSIDCEFCSLADKELPK
jgi:hypothetical protein